jgi:non-ribosomal peptide synthetase component E (peptide arylation enzyme)
LYPSPEEGSHWLDKGSWIDHTIGTALDAVARKYPDRPAFISDEVTISFSALNARSGQLAAALIRSGLKPGDRAIFQLGTTVDTVLMLVAAYKVGIIPVCAVPQYRELEIGQLVTLSQARAHIVQADFGAFDLVAFAEQMRERHASLEQVIIVRSDGPGTTSIDAIADGIPVEEAKEIVAAAAPAAFDVLSFQLSGGTTGVPKIIPRFHAEYLGHAGAWARRIALGPDERIIWSLPLLHNAGQVYVLVPALLSGTTAVLMPRVDIARMLELIELHGVTHALSIGPVAPQLIAYQELARHDLSSLRLFGTMNRADALEARLGLPCANIFGMTEGLLLGSGANEPAEIRHFTQGASGDLHDELRVVDPESGQEVVDGEVGELWFRGPSSLHGYFGSGQATADTLTAEGFVKTGDLMSRRVVDGHVGFTFAGRLRDNVNRGGEKIGCEEVEAVVSRHPSVADAKLVAMPDAFYGEKGCIFVILRPDTTAPTTAELVQHFVDQGVAKFKCPERIELIGEFPTTRVGKFDRAALARVICEIIAAEQQGEKQGHSGRRQELVK